MFRGCVQRVGCLVSVVLLAVGVWLYQDRALEWWQEWRAPESPGAVPSEELAERTAGRIEEFASGRGPDSLRLTPEGIRSLLVHRAAGELPPGVSDPRVTIGDSTAVLAGTLIVDSLASTQGSGRLRSLLGDSTSLEIEVVPDLLRRGVGQVTVRSLRAGGVPVPSFAIPFVLRESGLAVPEGYPRSVVFPLDTAVAGMRLSGGNLLVWRANPTERIR